MTPDLPGARSLLPTSREWVIGLVAAAIPALATLALVHDPDPWTALAPATCMPLHCFCEGLRPYLVRQPTNTITSFGFLIPAAIIFGRVAAATPGAPSAMRAEPVFPLLYGVALVMIGLGSAFYHASLTFVGQTIDVLGMYLIATFIIVYDVARLRPLSRSAIAVLYVVGNALLLWLLVAQPELRRFVFALLIVAGLAMEYRIRSSRRSTAKGSLLAAALAMLGVAFAIWTLDITGALCAPNAIAQGHGAWHLLGAASAGMLYLYYCSERRVQPVNAEG